MTTYPLLSIITFLPIVAALILALFLRGEDEGAARNAKWLALVATVATRAASQVVGACLVIGTPAAGRRRRRGRRVRRPTR